MSPTINAVDAVHIRIRGTVQGVGFRPTVWRVATGLGLVGSVRNDAEGVWVQLQGRSAQLDQFADALRDALPPLARLDQLLSHAAPVDLALTDFSIANSAEGS
ncbi:MAG TPA: carbamoyltransferase HypF, partial [Gammaproteobacteria bacterium]|nr:carbamoyltransferase HypF [Gammaproteobacteria bacterium]